MLNKVGLLRECDAAVIYRALERLFMCVRSHVVKDIVPFAELSAAALEVTKEDLSPSIALQIEVLNK